MITFHPRPEYPNFKAGDIVIANETIFNLVKGNEYEIARVNILDGIFLKDFENLSGGYGVLWFTKKPSESEMFAQNILDEIDSDIREYEELEREVNKK